MRIVESGSVTLKAALIGVIVLLLLIPLTMLKSVVTERVGLRELAYQRVAEGWGGGLTLGGPMLMSRRLGSETASTACEMPECRRSASTAVHGRRYLKNRPRIPNRSRSSQTKPR